MINDKNSGFQLKGNNFSLSVFQLFSSDLQYIAEQLEEKVALAPGFFDHTPVVIDLQLLDNTVQLDLSELLTIMRRFSLLPIGIQGLPEAQKELVLALGLASLNSVKDMRQSDKSEKEDSLEKKEQQKDNSRASSQLVAAESKVIDYTVRSGQQVYAPHGDLIITASVSPGAEILATGNIHVYGSLRGRALAGVNGQSKACIYCQSLEAELVSITGRYLLNEDLPDKMLKQPCFVRLENDKLVINELFK